MAFRNSTCLQFHISPSPGAFYFHPAISPSSYCQFGQLSHLTILGQSRTISSTWDSLPEHYFSRSYIYISPFVHPHQTISPSLHHHLWSIFQGDNLRPVRDDIINSGQPSRNTLVAVSHLLGTSQGRHNQVGTTFRNTTCRDLTSAPPIYLASLPLSTPTKSFFLHTVTLDQFFPV